MSAQFNVGEKYRIVDYENDHYLTLEILSRQEKWATVLLGEKEMQVRLYKVTNPLSESILLDGYSPVFSYNSINNNDNDNSIDNEDTEKDDD